MTGTVTVPIEALRNCHCPSDGRWTIGDCTDAGTCGCSIALKQRFCVPAQRPADPTAEDFEVLRELEVAWLTSTLCDSIANLGYPVGMGMAPNPEQIKKAATTLFDRYAKMIAMARGCAFSSTESGGK